MPYVRNTWYVAAWSHDLSLSQPLSVKILGERIAVYRTQTGQLVGLEDRCIHRMAPLSLGRCEGEHLRCMYHGLLFGPDGEVVEIPGQEIIPPQAKVRTYPVTERHNWIWVWMGDPDRAAPEAIPPAIGLDHPDYILAHGYLDYAAEAQLINDNLLDFSHIAYVHDQSFALGTEMAERQANITPLDNGIRYERWMENSSRVNEGQGDVPADGYMTYDFLIPGILLLSTSFYAAGTAKRLKYSQPDLSEATHNVSFTSQAVTPVEDRKARYFFSFGPHRAFGDESVRDIMMKTLDQAFHEDKVMIEAQQQVIDDTAVPRVMLTAHDRASTIFSRLVERFARADSTAIAAA